MSEDLGIPSYQALILPTLSALEYRRDIAFSEVWQRAASTAGLTNSETSETLPAGMRMEFANRVGICLNHLKHAGLVERVQRAIYRLTVEGCELLSRAPDKMGLPLLKTYPSYRRWLAAKRAQAEFDVRDGCKGALDRQGTDTTLDYDQLDSSGTEAVSDVMDDGAGTIYFSINYDPEVGMLPAFAEALLRCAQCTSCGATPQAVFSSCPCVKNVSSNAARDLRNRFEYRADIETWVSTLEPLWKKDRRRLYSRNSDAWRRRQARLHASKEPAYTNDRELLREIQSDSCYYCGTSISEKRHIEHLVPLSRGGSNGFNNIVLACPPCNSDKGLSTERQYWDQLRKRLSSEEYQRRRARANAIKAKKKHRMSAGQLSSGRFKRKRLIYRRSR